MVATESVSWPLRPLLDLRRREEDAASVTLGRAVARWRLAEAEALALRARAAEAAERALHAGAGIEAARWAARLRLEAERHGRQALDAEARAQHEAAVVETRRDALRQAGRAREVVEQLEEVWRRARALELARKAEAALDDRPWPAPAA